jgi:RND family efflux transporter MFP subunit
MNDDPRSSQLASLRISRPAESDADTGGGRPPWVMLVAGLAIGIVVVGFGAWFLWGRDAKAPAADASAPAPADTAPAAETKPSAPGSLVASGYVVARRRATVAAEITGRVAEVLVEEGMIVKRGQLLARLDDTLAATDLATANSRVESASATLAATRAELTDIERIQKRTQELARTHLVSDADVTKADTQVDDFRAQLTRSDAELTAARSDAKHSSEVLGKHRIVAPFDGVVVDKNAQPGEIISPMSAGGGFTRTGICTLVDMDSLEIEVDVNEAYISRVRPDQAVTATLDAYPDWSIPAKVIAIVPTANREKATVRVRIALLSKDPRILPDMAVKVSMSPAKPG